MKDNTKLNITSDNFITDNMTNTVYFSSLIDKLSGGFYTKDGGKLREALLKELSDISHEELYETRDVWARDYMPVQLTSELFLDYTYSPDYLYNEEKYRTNWLLHNVHTRKRPMLNLCTLRAPLILDGGNIIKALDKNMRPTIIMCDKVLNENSITETAFRKWWDVFFDNQIELILVKWEGKYINPIGHIDGMMRYISPGKMLIANYVDFGDRSRLRHPLEGKFDIKELHFGDNVGKLNPKLWKSMKERSWAYINFLQVGKHVIIPKLGWNDMDSEAKKQIEDAFGYSVEQIDFDMTDIVDYDEKSNGDGALNCLTWTVRV